MGRKPAVKAVKPVEKQLVPTSEALLPIQTPVRYSDKLPDVTVLICTYNRPKELRETVFSLRNNLKYPPAKLHYVICDDHSPDKYVADLKAQPLIQSLDPEYVITAKNSGWGANVNNGLAAVKTPYVFFLEDDYVLTQSLDLTVGVALLETRRNIGMLRYRGTAGDHVVFHQFESDISEYCPNYQDGVGLPGKLTYLQLDSGSPSLYLYSHGPHLKRLDFHVFYGMYPVGLKLGETEETYAHTVKDGMKQPNAPALAILPEYISMRFDHVGTSYQGSEWDK